jgi:hypothetical protein
MAGTREPSVDWGADRIKALVRKNLFLQQFPGGGEGGIRTHVPELPDHPISSRRRYDHFGTSPAEQRGRPRLASRPHFAGLVF